MIEDWLVVTPIKRKVSGCLVCNVLCTVPPLPIVPILQQVPFAVNLLVGDG